MALRGGLRIGITVAIFFATLLILGLLLGSPTCADGTRPAWIGKKDACSLHGGIDRTKPQLLRLLGTSGSIALGWLLLTLAADVQNAQRAGTERPTPEPQPAKPPRFFRCTRCGAEASRVTMRRGDQDLSHWVCQGGCGRIEEAEVRETGARASDRPTR
jgi:hypothetical protein